MDSAGDVTVIVFPCQAVVRTIVEPFRLPPAGMDGAIYLPGKSGSFGNGGGAGRLGKRGRSAGA